MPLQGRNDTAYSSTTWAYSFADDRWEVLNTSALKPRARYGGAGGVYGDQLFLSMGWSAGGRRLSDTWVLNTTSGRYGLPYCILSFASFTYILCILTFYRCVVRDICGRRTRPVQSLPAPCSQHACWDRGGSG